MDRLQDVDTVAADLLHGVVRGLEENLWMIGAQAPEQLAARQPRPITHARHSLRWIAFLS